jgi:hypothetical protein
VKHSCGTPLLDNASRSWVLLQDSMFLVVIPIFKSETFLDLLCKKCGVLCS